MQKVLNVLCGIIYIIALFVLSNTDFESYKLSALILFSHVLFVGGITFTSDYAGRSKVWRSFAGYVFVQAIFWHFVSQISWWGQLIAAVLFLIVGCYHTYLIDEKELFSDDHKSDEEQDKPINPNKKYRVWAVMSIVSLLVAFLW